MQQEGGLDNVLEFEGVCYDWRGGGEYHARRMCICC